MGMPRLRLMVLQRRISQPISQRARRNLGRHLLAASHRAFLDSEQTAWVVLPDERTHVFETQPADPLAFFNSARHLPVAPPLKPDGMP